MKAAHILTFCMFLGYGGDASAQVFKGRPNCPENNGFKTSWLDWVTAREKDNNNAFKIVLNKQSPMIGILKPGECQTAFGNKNGIRLHQRTSSGWRLEHLGKIDAETKSFTYADHTLSFNEGGDLFLLNYGLVGSFKCKLRPCP